MIRTVTNKSGEFIVINTFLEVKDQGGIVRLPMYVQIDVTTLDQDTYSKVFKGANSTFNRVVTVNLSKPVKNEKSWWKKIFNK